MNFRHLELRIKLAGLFVMVLLLVTLIVIEQRSIAARKEVDAKIDTADEITALIDAALYTRHEFFGAQAIVPYPTAEARNRLGSVQMKYPRNPRIHLKLAQLDEKLGREEQALNEMRTFVELETDKLSAHQTMSEFLHRRARFDAEAESLEQMLQIAPPERRVDILRRLMELAETHVLAKYLKPQFYEQVLAENPSAFDIVEQYQQRLIEKKNYQEALNLLRQSKAHFPEHRREIMEYEISVLDKIGRAKEAEAVYTQAFDPFWPSELAENFYQFLRDHDRFRAYGRGLREAFRRNPADFNTAVRLLHYSKHAGEDSPNVFVELEKARAERHIAWPPDELITITRLLIADGYGEAASRFLYTLYLQGDLKPGSITHAKVLYQLFELLSDAGNQRLSLTRGDLKFYQDIATADPHPGIIGGILSLILCDTNPKEEFALEEERAVVHFNRAAAYRIFSAYKLEYPTAPELAQMYLDIVRLYTANRDLKLASQTLAEFEKRHQDAPQYPEVALKLADCYIVAGKYDEERALYQRILDYLGEHRAVGVSGPSGTPSNGTNLLPALDILSEPTTIKPPVVAYPPISNPGINYSNTTTSNESYGYQYSAASGFSDHLSALTRKDDEDLTTESGIVNYQTVLARYVASLAKDNRTADILALYANEIKKYPDEQGLYEQMLQWLGQTNMVEEQLRVYREALQRFPSMTWQDRLARWFLRYRRTAEFESLSRDLLGRVNDEEAAKYLRNFIDANVNADASSFDAQLYLALYSLAHQRFPRNLNFVNGLLKFYSAHQQWQQWRTLIAEYYFESRESRDQFLSHLASHNELRGYLSRARENLNNEPADSQALLPYKLFRADAAAWLSNYEEAIDAYRELNRIYPNSPEFAERLISFTRSLGQHNRRFLEESAAISTAFADAVPSVAAYRLRAGEIQAELGDYSKALGEWEQLISSMRGDSATYLDTATIYWDYFQYDDALRTIRDLRRQMNDETVYAFQAGVILEDKHQLTPALAEYVKALANNNFDAEGTWSDVARARKRLVTLSKRPGVYERIAAAFIFERKRDPGWEFVWEYANFLIDSEHWPEASRLLRDEVRLNDSAAFLRRARDLFEAQKETDGQVAALQRLVATAPNQRLASSFRLQLADVYSAHGQAAKAADMLRALVEKYPTNYGVLSESADFYWRLGQRTRSIAVLQMAMRRGVGRFHYLFGRKLAARQVEMRQLAAAQQVLENLNREDRLNTEVFHELAKLYVRTGNQQALRAAFKATVEAIKNQDIDTREIRAEVAQFREEMIEAFTLLKDYASAIEQHIEIINRDPEDELNLDRAINYVRRYGGGDVLLSYYQRTAQAAYKNYRWNVVLARIYDAKGDLLNAAQQYHAALTNQPEMTELYSALADVYARATDYNAAIAALRKAEEISNEDPQYIQRLVVLLEKAGRHSEAEIERRKLPQEVRKVLSVSEQFAEAARLRSRDLKTSTENYRQAFNTFTTNPFKSELRAADIVGYVQTVRVVDGLDQVTKRLWDLRRRLVAEAEKSNGMEAGKARDLFVTLDGAVIEGVGSVAAERATGDELSALFSFLDEQTKATLKESGDKSDTLEFLRNLSRRSGLGSIEEEVLRSLKDRDYSLRNWPSYHNRVRALVDLYDERGAYKQIIDLLETEHARDPQLDSFDYAGLIANNARLLGDSARELQALREYYQRLNTQNQLVTSQDPLVERYFEALWESGTAGKDELLACARRPTSHHFQLITFLLRKEDKELVHIAIDNSPSPAVWKLSRNAEASLELGEFDTPNETYFSEALEFQPIGDLIKQKPDTSLQLVGDDWFRLAQSYGRWLHASQNTEQKLKSRSLLPALIENRPQDTDQQARLGRWYLNQKELDLAIEHLELAHEAQPENKTILADLGSAFFLRGNKQKARELWEKIIEGESSIEDYRLYLETLVAHQLNQEARNRLTGFVTTRLDEDFQDENATESKRSEDTENFRRLIRALAASFSDRVADDARPGKVSSGAEAAKVRYFAELCAAAPHNRFLPAFLIREALVSENAMGAFYQLLLKRAATLSRYDHDYAYTSLMEESFDDSKLECLLDQKNEYKRVEPDSEKSKWQKEYLDYLIKRRLTAEARILIASIEADLRHRYGRPVWLRIASLKLDLREGNITHVVDELERLVGIKTDINWDETRPPSIERLNDALKLLREEKRHAETGSLLTAYYARELALEQFEPAYFAGLARIAFERGDKTLALKWLQSMIDLTNHDRSEQTKAALMQMPLIKAHALESQSLQSAGENVAFDQTQALRVAAETAGEFNEFDAAIRFRQQLLALFPVDEENRIELIRLLSANGKTDEAIKTLADIVSDRTATRSLRWQSVWLAAELAGTNPSLWAELRERARTHNPADTEMNTALDSLSLSAAGQIDQALKVISDAEVNDPNAHLTSLRAILEKEGAAHAVALDSFTRALIASRESTVWQSFSFLEDDPLEQIVSLYLKQGQPRAALKVAERLSLLHSDKTNPEQTVDGEMEFLHSGTAGYQTLHQRARERERDAHAKLLEMLSLAADEIGDLNRAREIEQTRLRLLRSEPDRNAAQVRIDRLLESQKGAANQRKLSLVIDLKLVAGG